MGKKVITIENEVKTASETILKGSASIYYNVNGVLLSKNKTDGIIIVVPEKPLLEKLLEINDITIEELTMDDPDRDYYNDIYRYGEDLNNIGWLPLPDDFCDGNKMEIDLKDYDYPVEISSALLPIKLKKSERGDISYRVFTNPLVIGLKKYFRPVNEGYGFSMLRLFRVI